MRRYGVMTCLVLMAAPLSAEDQPNDAKAITLDEAPAVVVETVPRAGDATVDPATAEIRVTFSKDMLDKSWSWVRLSHESFPEATGEPKYLDRRACVMPVKLEPGHTYAIWLNSQKYGNFKDHDRRSAVPYLLVFKTRDARR